MHVDITEQKRGEERSRRFGSAMDAIVDAKPLEMLRHRADGSSVWVEAQHAGIERNSRGAIPRMCAAGDSAASLGENTGETS
jgi:hypothetical protein